MKVVAGLALLLLNVRLSCSCYGDGQVLFCPNMPPAFSAGYSSLVMVLKDVGEINSTVLRSDNLASVTRLRIEDAGVTGVAEGAFGSFQNLTNLSLNQNLLSEINPSWFGRPDILAELNLTENQIEVLSESSLSGLVNLTRLRLNKNRIRTIDPNSFSSNTMLAELDLSENRMTRLPPQVFRSLRSTRIRLDGNPWDCSCGAEDFVNFLKDLQSRSLLDRQVEVTCEGPPSLRGQPAWDVTVCVTPPPPAPPAVTQTVHPKPTDALTTSTEKPVTAPPSKTETSVQSKPSDAPIMTSSRTVQPTSETKTSVQHRYPHTTYVTSPPPVTEISVHPKPSDLPTTTSAPTGMTETSATSQPSSDTNNVCTLIVVIVVLSSLLFVMCLLAVLHRRKRSSKTVMPGSSKENRNELQDDDGGSRSSHAQSPGRSEKRENDHWDSEMGWRRSFTGVIAKSADAILFTSPFCAAVKDQVASRTETEASSNESEVDRGPETENLTNASDVNAKRAADGGNLDENSHCVPVNTDAVPYLSIGTTQNKANPDPDDFKKPGQRSQTVNVMGRISTWPPTAVQWQERCKMKADVFTVWTPKFPGELKEMFNKVEPPSGSDRDRQEEQSEINQIKDPLKINAAHVRFVTNDETTSLSEAGVKQEEQLQEETIQDSATVRNQNLDLGQNQDEKPAHKNPNKISHAAEKRDERTRAATRRERAENRSTGSRAPSGGASPDDETLLSGNEYAFMDLLHEVVQNNGRWTRERWRQMHVNKQRRLHRGTEGVQEGNQV